MCIKYVHCFHFRLYVTTTAHQYLGLTFSTGEIDESKHPSGGGPMYLHKGSKTEDINPFFAHLSLKLELDAKSYKYPIGRLLIGTDGEQSLIISLKHNFPTAIFFICQGYDRSKMKILQN